MKIKVLKQKHSSGCGPTSIKMVTNYFGIKLPMKKIEEICGMWKEDGMGNHDLVNSLEKLGFSVHAQYNSTWEELVAQNTKDYVVIVSWMLKGYIGHFSVIDKINDKYIWLADPESGKIVKLEKNIFMRLWYDYDDIWYPEKNSDFKLRWMAVVSKKK